MAVWSEYEEKQARRFIWQKIDRYGKNLNADECEEIAWVAYFEVRRRYRDNLASADYWVSAGRKIKSELDKFRRIRNERITWRSQISLNAPVGENGEELLSLLPAKHSDFANSAVFWAFVRDLGELKYRIIVLLSQEEEDYDIIRMLRISYEEYYRELLEIRDIFEREYL